MRVAAQLELRKGDREELTRIASSRTAQAGLARRARIMLLAEHCRIPRLPGSRGEGERTPPDSCGPADWQPFDAALEIRSQVGRLARVSEGRRAGEDFTEERAHLDAGEVGAQAEVRAVAEH
jgi:hypothetical protein